MLLSFILPPLFGFLINAFLFQSSHKKLSGFISTCTCLISFLAVVFYCFVFGFEQERFFVFPWFEVGNLKVSFSFVVDSLSLLFCLLITGVGFLIHLYSMAYMSKDDRLCAYFSYLNLFVFMMLILVLAENLPLLFVGWEGVGLCSYLLIGFWFKEKKNVQAGMMAFIVNRIGDACFLLGIFLLFSQFGTFSFSDLNGLFTSENSNLLPSHLQMGALGAFLLFLGATGKSAQLPLFFWLPEAMAGPTPVSALIHAATMVTAGVYMIVRLSGFYSAFPDVLLVIGWLGAITALATALIATRQWDLKKILAYSTISQLAYLFMALGVQAFSSSIFHLLTHGFFKALLFLCAGSIIHALNGQQDIRFMGGLRKVLPISFITYLAGALALIALPPFSGFFSKDEILWSLFSSGNYALFFMAFVTGLCTVFYMTRLTVLIFFGKARFNNKPHEAPVLMILPLGILAFLSLFSGILGIPHLFSKFMPGHPPHFLQELLKNISPLSFQGSLFTEALLMALSVLTGLIVLGWTASFYLKKGSKERKPSFWKNLLEQAFFIQKGVQSFIKPWFSKFSSNLYQHIEQAFLHKSIFFLSQQVLKLRSIFSLLQNGNLQSYALYFVIGLNVFIFLIFLR